MNTTDVPLMIGFSIISEMHEYFREKGHDDLEHIINLSLVIKGISKHLKQSETSEEEINRVLTELKEYGKKLWIEYCVEVAGEDDSESDVREETDYIFDYIFEHHEHPY